MISSRSLSGNEGFQLKLVFVGAGWLTDALGCLRSGHFIHGTCLLSSVSRYTDHSYIPACFKAEDLPSREYTSLCS